MVNNTQFIHNNIIVTDNRSLATSSIIQNLSHTPVSKRDNGFKSPAPSTKKYLSINNHKSPMITTNNRVNASNSKNV